MGRRAGLIAIAGSYGGNPHPAGAGDRGLLRWLVLVVAGLVIGHASVPPEAVDEWENEQMSRTEVFDTPGTYTWTCPPGVTEVILDAHGATSGDGVPGQHVHQKIAVRPGVAYQLDIAPAPTGAGGSVIAGPFSGNAGAVMFGAGGGGGSGQSPSVAVGHGAGAGQPGRIVITY